VKNSIPENEYVDALLRDLEQELPAIWGRRVETIFFGGGTPSLFSVASMDRLLAGVRALVPLSANAEITLEANPGTAEAEKFSGFRQLGINRLSIGVQSFNNEMLTKIGRIHDAGQAQRAVAMAKNAGFDNINIDLMFGLPGQSIEQAKQDVETALTLCPTHISYYHLTLEPNTYFHAHPPILPDDEMCWDIQAVGQQMLADAGYAQYEVSAYAQVGRQCRHNLNYWRFGDYVGIGAGAHGKITRADTQSISRYSKLKHPADYMGAAGTPSCLSSAQMIGEADVAFEYMLNVLRLREGFTPEHFARVAGVPYNEIESKVKDAAAQGLLEVTADRIVPTELGRNFLNDLINRFI
jgi:oxygen-independent coproporphyrinogen-3 oxidase